MADEQIGYAAAVERLEAILRELEGDDVDVDRLGERVRTAVELIRVCRERITEAELEVSRIVAELEEGPRDDGASGEAADQA